MNCNCEERTKKGYYPTIYWTHRQYIVLFSQCCSSIPVLPVVCLLLECQLTLNSDLPQQLLAATVHMMQPLLTCRHCYVIEYYWTSPICNVLPIDSNGTKICFYYRILARTASAILIFLVRMKVWQTVPTIRTKSARLWPELPSCMPYVLVWEY